MVRNIVVGTFHLDPYQYQIISHFDLSILVCPLFNFLTYNDSLRFNVLITYFI